MKTKFHLFLLSILFFYQLNAQVTITKSQGWLESAYVEWEPISEAQSYNVYYSGEGITDRKIDTQLIRSYGTYFRADVMGIAAGTYTIKVVPVISGTEGTAATTSSLTVKSHDRTGFSFWNGRVPGAYKTDGTPKDNAQIIYITEKTKNTVSLEVTGANTNPCVGLQAIFDGFKKGKDARPLIVRLIGQITDFSYMLNGDVVIENNNNASSYITMEGVGDDAVADGWGIRIKNASNIEVRNLGTMNCNSDEGDNIGLQQGNDYIWIHNCDMFYGDAGSDADQAKGDGALDCKKSTYVTFSYNHFWDSGKCNLLGLSEGTTSGLFITYQHNWYDHSDSRHPRVRFYSAHVYNNYYDGNAKYGVGSTEGSSVFVEANYYRNCKYPMLISMQGSDVWDASKQANDYKDMPTFSKENGGIIKAYNNYMIGQHRFVPYGDTNTTNPNPAVDFDAYVATSRNEQVPSTVKSVYGSNTYNNFDTNSSLMYSYTPDSPEDAKTNVMQYAGRVTGGDFKWTFDNSVDDASYTVNTRLKLALTNYKTTLVFVQGEGDTSSSQTLDVTGSKDQTVTAGSAISDIIFTWGGDATDVVVTGLPASGLDYTKNNTAKTITISGTPTANVTYTMTTSGSAGDPVSSTGTITVGTSGGSSSGDMIHNFTLAGKTNAFYSISGNLSSNYGTVTYNELTLTQCLKMESSTSITFTTTQSATTTLVFNKSYSGTIKVDGVVYSQDENGLIIVTLEAGAHEIKKGSGSSYLFYMSTVNNGSSGVNNTKITNIKVYPNPATSYININSSAIINNVSIYNLSGALVKQLTGNVRTIDVEELQTGSYLISIKTNEGSYNQQIIKR